MEAGLLREEQGERLPRVTGASSVLAALWQHVRAAETPGLTPRCWAFITTTKKEIRERNSRSRTNTRRWPRATCLLEHNLFYANLLEEQKGFVL
jgi:hypothetical protein